MHPNLESLMPPGRARLRLLSCLATRYTVDYEYLKVEQEQTLFEAYAVYAYDMVGRWQSLEANGPVRHPILAACRLLAGNLADADIVLDLLPEVTPKLDHGAGYCLVAAVYALAAALPLPPHLKDTTRWVANSQEQSALKQWLADHRDRLRWDMVNATYHLAPLP